MIHVSKAHRAIGVPLRADLANLFPHGKQVTLAGNPLIVVPHGVDEYRVLRNLGIDVPAPILSQYDWAGGTPYEVQMKTAALLTTNHRAYVLNGMGTGKTKSALWSYDYLASIGLARRAIIVAPLSTLHFTWAREVFNTIPHRSVTVLHGTKERRLKRLAEPHDIYVVNPDGLEIIEAALTNRPDIDTLIIDELAVFRNAASQRNKVARRLAQRFTWAWGMTGSPTPNAPTDAYGQCRILTPHTVPKHFGRFRDQVMSKVTQFKFEAREDANKQVLAVMQPAVRFSLDDVVELPDLIERTIDIELGKKQKEVYDQLRQHAYAAVQSGEVTAANAGAVLMKLLQVSLGYVYGKDPATGDRTVVTLDNAARLEALVDDVTACDQKVIIFAPFRHAIEGIVTRLSKEGFDVATIHGGVPKGDRDKIFPAFQQTTKYKVLVADPATMAHGITLTAASTIIWFGPTNSLETFEQANARIRRIGQKNKQQVLMYQATAAERRMYRRLRAKQAVQTNLLEMFADATQ